MSSDITFYALVVLEDAEQVQPLINTMDPYRDDRIPSLESKLIHLESTPLFSSVKKLSDTEVLFAFDHENAFIASETIFDISQASNCYKCFSLEQSDVNLFVRYEDSGKQALLYSNDSEYEFEIPANMQQDLMALENEGSIAQLIYLSKY